MNDLLFDCTNTQGVTQWKYPEKPGSKKEGTSSEAAEKIAPQASTLRDKCLSLLRQGNHTSDEIAGILGRSVLAVRPRVSELIALGKARETGERRRNESGLMAAVLEAV